MIKINFYREYCTLIDLTCDSSDVDEVAGSSDEISILGGVSNHRFAFN